MSTILILPPADAIAAAVATLKEGADTKRQVALNKAQYDLTLGLAIVPVAGAFLVPSSSRSGLIHRVDHLAGCDCEAGRAGRSCRHKLAIEIVEEAQRHTMPALPMADRLAGARKATTLLNELFA